MKQLIYMKQALSISKPNAVILYSLLAHQGIEILKKYLLFKDALKINPNFTRADHN